MNVIQTNYRVIGQKNTYEGNCAIPESVWRHSSDEFPQEPFIPTIGICDDPVFPAKVYFGSSNLCL